MRVLLIEDDAVLGEAVRDHLDQIRDLEGYTVPSQATDEFVKLLPLLQG